MSVRYFLIKTEKPKLVRHSKGQTEAYDVNSGWTVQNIWYDRIFFSDFNDFEEITKKEADIFISGARVV